MSHIPLIRRCLAVAALLLCPSGSLALAQESTAPAAPAPAVAPAEPAGQPQRPQPTRVEFPVDSLKREAIVVAPESAGTRPAPLVFAFHGHGGSARQYMNSAAIHKAWPEAIVIYPQGLPTPGMTDPQGKKSGWEKTDTDQGGRDLKFFDAMLSWANEKYKVDTARVYSTGHSNGGGFTYLLWAHRPEVFAAMGPSSAGPNRASPKLTAKPAIHIAGRDDSIVPFVFQRGVMNTVKGINSCGESGTAWAPNCTIFDSTTGTPLVECIHDGGHKYYEDATELIVRFFKEHTRPQGPPSQGGSKDGSGDKVPAATTPAAAPPTAPDKAPPAPTTDDPRV